MGTTTTKTVGYRGNDKVLLGIILGLLSFWLFAMTFLSIRDVIEADLGISTSSMSLAITLTSLFSGMTIVMFGNLGDKIGRVKIMKLGYFFAIAGALLIAFTPANHFLMGPMMILGRVLQGLSGACIMPTSLALLSAYWDERGRQRAVSLWSMGTWGGTSFATFIGTSMAQYLGWRSIFILAALTSLLGLFLVREVPESKATPDGKEHKFDKGGMILFMIFVLSIMLVVNYGTEWGWLSTRTLVLLGVAIVSFVLFYRHELGLTDPFVDFKLFRNKTFTGATISNFLLNSTSGVLVVIPALMLHATDIDPSIIGLLSIGYGVVIISFIRVGEKLLRKFGPRDPMLWGCIILLTSIFLMIPTNTMRETYMYLMAIGYALFGLGLAFYATPSTDAALSSLPPNQSAGGSGIYKMASSLGSAFGIAVSSSIYYSLSQSGQPLKFINDIFIGVQDNVHFRQAAMIALMFNAIMIIIAIFSIMLTVPKRAKRKP